MAAPPVNCQNYDPPDYGLFSIDPSTQCSNGHQYLPQRVFKVGVLTPNPNMPNYIPMGSPPVCSSTGDSEFGRIAYLATEVDPTKFAEVKTAVQHDP